MLSDHRRDELEEVERSIEEAEPFPLPNTEPRYPRDVFVCRCPDGRGWWAPTFAVDYVLTCEPTE